MKLIKNFWSQVSGVMTVFKKSLADGEIWFVEGDIFMSMVK